MAPMMLEDFPGRLQQTSVISFDPRQKESPWFILKWSFNGDIDKRPYRGSMIGYSLEGLWGCRFWPLLWALRFFLRLFRMLLSMDPCLAHGQYLGLEVLQIRVPAHGFDFNPGLQGGGRRRFRPMPLSRRQVDLGFRAKDATNMALVFRLRYIEPNTTPSHGPTTQK